MDDLSRKLDARKTLSQLKSEWVDCEACDLGKRRKYTDGKFVFGEGPRNGILLVAEGPGEAEAQMGRPFVGRSGSLLRFMFEKLQFENYYLTNIVSCRSCSPRLDEQGLPMMRRVGNHQVPLYRDETPLPSHIEACKARLYEEIYLVDPVLIVTLGVPASELLLGRKVSIQTQRGPDGQGFARIPAVLDVPVVTEKRGLWARMKDGKLHLPTRPGYVEYHVIPTLHPAFVLRKKDDRGPGNPTIQLFEDLRHAVNEYYRYQAEALGKHLIADTDPVSIDDFVTNVDEEGQEEEHYE